MYKIKCILASGIYSVYLQKQVTFRLRPSPTFGNIIFLSIVRDTYIRLKRHIVSFRLTRLIDITSRADDTNLFSHVTRSAAIDTWKLHFNSMK